jgi:drug/metabolite transporter (DMT)-like permease
MPYVWFALICTIWGSSFILDEAGPRLLLSAGDRHGSGGLRGSGADAGVAESRQAARLCVGVISGCSSSSFVTGFAWPYCLQPVLIGRHGSAFIGMTVGFTPLLTLMLGTVMLGSRPTSRQVIGVTGALLCLCVLMWDGWQRAVPASDLALAFSVPFTYALANNWIRRSLSHIPSVELTLLCLAGCGGILLPLALAVPGPPEPTANDWLIGVSCLAALGVLGTGVATCLFTRLIQEQGPLFAAMVTNLVPLFAIGWGWADAETITAAAGPRDGGRPRDGAHRPVRLSADRSGGRSRPDSRHG